MDFSSTQSVAPQTPRERAKTKETSPLSHGERVVAVGDPVRGLLLARSPKELDSQTSSPLQSCQLVQAVKRGCLVTLRQRRIVKHRIDEVLHRPLENEYRLADVQKF